MFCNFYLKMLNLVHLVFLFLKIFHCLPKNSYIFAFGCYELVNVNSQGSPRRHTEGILTFEKMCCQSPLYGSNVPCHKYISALGRIVFFMSKCSSMGVVYQTMLHDCQFLVIFASPVTHVLSYKYKNRSM